MPRTIDLRLELEHVTPRVWRLLRVPHDLRLDDLHQAMQCVFGWNDFHSHVFEVGSREYGPAVPAADDEDEGAEESPEDESRLTVTAALAASGGEFAYVYDFAEHWRVRVAQVEAAATSSDHGSQAAILCVAGEHAGPQRDRSGDDTFSVEECNRRVQRALRPRATPAQPAGQGATSEAQLLAQLTLAVLRLGSRETRHGTRAASRQLRPSVLSSLHDAGLIVNDESRQTVTLTPDGAAQAERWLQRLSALQQES